MRLKINISTCPNDTFMFEAMLHKKIDTMGYEFDLFMADIEQLNTIVAQNSVDISKMSTAAYPIVSKNYQISDSGSALGHNSGPLLVSKTKLSKEDIPHIKIGIPGKNTTANRLLKYIFGEKLDTKEYLFSDISSAILDNEVDAGVLIHEERFLYKSKGLSLLCDLGEAWEKKTSMPIPLGSIVINRNLDDKIKTDIVKIISNSIIYAINNPTSSYNFVKQHAKELSEDVIEQHIKMFVNNYSISMGDIGRKSIIELLKEEDINSNTFLHHG